MHIATASLPPPTVKIAISILEELSPIDLFHRAGAFHPLYISITFLKKFLYEVSSE